MKKVRTIRIDKEVSDNLDSICNRHGDVSWHIENALKGYGPIKDLAPKKPKPADINSGCPGDDFEFDRVWARYGKKGNRKGSRTRFLKLSISDQRKVFYAIPDYVLSTPDKQYRKNFETYINQECWNDEVTPNGPNQPGRPTATGRGTPAERTREAQKRWEATQESHVQIVGSDAGDLRPSVQQPVRGGADRFMGETIDGDYTSTD